METFTASDLNFSNSAIAHFNKVLKDRGRGEGVRLGIKKSWLFWL
jgi:Fe-S cluster assembly iron-binding protein IscA